MNVATLTFDVDADRTHAGWAMAVSVTLHALLVAWLLIQPRLVQQAPLTEITWLDGEGGAPAQAAPTLAARVARILPLRRAADERPELQADLALGDRLNARLSALQSSSAGASPLAVSGTGTAAALSTPAVPNGLGGGGEVTPLELTRGRAAPAPALAQAAAPTRASAPAPAEGGSATARRTLAGASIIGPVADRAVLHHETPVYPEWAKRDAVEGSVTLSFVVRADGTVKENVLVQKTAGFQEFDENARVALLAWRFEPLREGRTGEQWGTITFRYRLQDAR